MINDTEYPNVKSTDITAIVIFLIIFLISFVVGCIAGSLSNSNKMHDLCSTNELFEIKTHDGIYSCYRADKMEDYVPAESE